MGDPVAAASARCPVCDRPKATAEDHVRFGQEHPNCVPEPHVGVWRPADFGSNWYDYKCWSPGIGVACTKQAVDWRARALTTQAQLTSTDQYARERDTMATHHARLAADARFREEVAAQEGVRLREALEMVRDCAKEIMPAHENLEKLRSVIVSVHDATWTRLFSIYFVAEAALTPPPAAPPKSAPVLKRWHPTPSVPAPAPERCAACGEILPDDHVRKIESATGKHFHTGCPSRAPVPPTEGVMNLNWQHCKAPPTVVTLCGSTRFMEQFFRSGWVETLAGRIVLSVGVVVREGAAAPPLPNDHLGEHFGVKDLLDEIHFRKIDLSTEILVLNVGGYVGASTQREIAYAMATGKRVRFLDEPAGLEMLEARSHEIGHQVAAFAMGRIPPTAAPPKPAGEV